MPRPSRPRLAPAPGIRSRVLFAACAFGALAACSSTSDNKAASADAGDTSPNAQAWVKGKEIPAVTQSEGDPVKGRQILLNGSYMSCGLPWKLWSDPTIGSVVQKSFGPIPDGKVDGREGKNADLPYSVNAFTTPDGAEVVNRNCLTCHGGSFDGEVIIGLGNPTADFTAPPGGSAQSLPANFFDSFGLSAAEKSSLDKVLRFGKDIGPDMAMRTIGLNPAEQITGVLLAHHDKDTLAWSSTPLLEVNKPKDAQGNLIPDARLTSDPPPWWRAHKKNAMFYNGMARGEHRGTMALASSICVDNLDEAKRIDGLFKDIQSFIGTIRSPDYKRPVDATLAAAGKKLFERDCAACHGTYADDPQDDDNDTYPNFLIPLDVVKTDPAVAMAPIDNKAEVDWYNASFYGSITPAMPDDPLVGYMPPPLDGIWATAPYLHNGSVPNLELVLNSKARPKYWKRVDFDDTNFDEERVGWPFEETGAQADEADPEKKKLIYDTTYYSQTNTGHTFGDHFTTDERRSVIEYLKTL